MPSSSNPSAEPPTPFSIAQEALKRIAACQLPPTPVVYQVWYSHIDGSNPALSDELEVRIGDPGSITLEFIESLHVQYCASHQSGDDQRIADQLAESLDVFRSIVVDQKVAGENYSEKIGVASEAFIDADPEQFAKAVQYLADETRAMQLQLETMRQRVSDAEEKANALQTELQQARAAMMIDHLTGLGNRRFYESVLRQTVRSLQAAGAGSSEDEEATFIPYLALIDCDRFKSINDTYGHPFGDDVIKMLGDILARGNSDASVARLGGDEFAVFARFGSDDDVAQFTERIRESVRSVRLIDPKSGEQLTRLTLSIGVARVRSGDSEDSWHSRADKMLYKAKHLGGDRAVIERRLAH